MGLLTTKARKKLSASAFAGPDRSYPIEDENHARNALARVSQYGTPELKSRVHKQVKRKYPGIK